MSHAVVKHCPKCKPHKFQDEKYGNLRRVMNQTVTTPNTPKKYRCTVCLAEHTDG